MVVERDSTIGAVPAVRPARGGLRTAAGWPSSAAECRQCVGTPKVRWSAAHSAVHVLDLKRGPRRAKAASHYVRRLVAGGRLPGGWRGRAAPPQAAGRLTPGIQPLGEPSQELAP